MDIDLDLSDMDLSEVPKKDKRFVVYQNSIGEEEFGSLEEAVQHIAQTVLQDFSISKKGESEDDDSEDIPFKVSINVSLQ
jgi:hypothetical protein